VADKLEEIRRMWDDSARRHADRVLAIHFTEGGWPVEASVYEDIYARIDALVGFAKGDTVLEVGAGSGLLLERIAPNVRFVHGTDISREILKRIPPLENIFLSAMDSARLEFPDGSMDKVVCNTVIQCFPDKAYARSCFLEMVRVCRPGGKIYVGDIFNAYLRKYYEQECGVRSGTVRKAIRRFRERMGWEAPAYDILYLHPHEIAAWAREAGCGRFQALLDPGTRKPLLFRAFRFDVLAEK